MDYTYTSTTTGRAWIRHDPPTPATRASHGRATVRCTGPTDTSPEHHTSRNYDPACGYCWLGGPHTADYHAAAIVTR